MKMKKARLLTSLMLLPLASSFIIKNQVEARGYYLYSGGTGHADDPFIIKTTEDWESLRMNVAGDDLNASQENIYFRLDADIRVTGGVANNDENKPFKGHFDGNGHSIEMKIGLAKTINGLFGTNYGTIKNLTSKGRISGSGSLGGIVGHNYGLVENCVNEMTVAVSSNFVGGVVGINGTNDLPGKVRNCINKGVVYTIAATSQYANNGNCLGGVVGFSYSPSGTEISNCYNFGEVRGISALGGIVGWIKNNAPATYSNLYNFGNVIGKAGSDGEAYCGHIGGIVGNLTTGNNLINCVNAGNIEGVGGQTSGYWRGVGGIVGSFYGSDITSCFNGGNVKAKMMAGGIAGYSQSNTAKTISSCYSGGNISTTGANAGGIIGRANTTTISNNVSFAKVSGASEYDPISGRGGTLSNNTVYPNAIAAADLISIVHEGRKLNAADLVAVKSMKIRIAALEETLGGDDETILNLKAIDENKTYASLLSELKTRLNSIPTPNGLNASSIDSPSGPYHLCDIQEGRNYL